MPGADPQAPWNEALPDPTVGVRGLEPQAGVEHLAPAEPVIVGEGSGEGGGKGEGGEHASHREGGSGKEVHPTAKLESVFQGASCILVTRGKKVLNFDMKKDTSRLRG